ncbi:peptidoglycan-binding domain-containing protein [Streptomyces umbrinus]|uniref:peptidoglycan-binding domain-containing protein n=1 Tax=Streptomyces umbrinus TaxID=67370 RepID=UPI003593FA8D
MEWLQFTLNSCDGFNLATDGEFGSNTRSALASAQQQERLTADAGEPDGHERVAQALVVAAVAAQDGRLDAGGEVEVDGLSRLGGEPGRQWCVGAGKPHRQGWVRSAVPCGSNDRHTQ